MVNVTCEIGFKKSKQVETFMIDIVVRFDHETGKIWWILGVKNCRTFT